MSRAPDWTEEEFVTVLTNPNLSPEQLGQRLNNRSPDAVEIIQNGIHAFHAGLDISMLSKMMQSRLEGDIHGLICPICKLPLDL